MNIILLVEIRLISHLNLCYVFRKRLFTFLDIPWPALPNATPNMLGRIPVFHQARWHSYGNVKRKPRQNENSVEVATGMGPSGSDRPLALYHAAAQQAAFLGREIGARVHRTEIVPHHEIVDAQFRAALLWPVTFF